MIDRAIATLFSQSRMVCDAEIVFLAIGGLFVATVIALVIFFTEAK